MRPLRHLMQLFPISLLIACAGQVAQPVDISGGAQAIGGNPSVGGTIAMAGGSSTGGTHALGGATSARMSTALGGTLSLGGATVTTGGKATSTTGGAAATSGALSSICNGLFSSCGLSSTNQTVKTPNMLIVLDESGSMTQTPTGDTVSKWTAMSNALSGALSVSKVRQGINFGLELFPNSGDPSNPITSASDPTASCMVPTGSNYPAIEVPIISGTDQLNAILSAIQSSTPAGGTPTDMALQQAYTYFTTSPGKDLPGKKYILLATDGGPNCNPSLSCTKDTCTQNLDLQCGDHTATTTVNCCADAGYICLDDSATIGEIGNLAAAGIATYVVGIPGSEAYVATLNAMALAGGVPNTTGSTRYYAVSSMADLQATFSQIVTQLVTTCDIPLSENPTDVTKVQVAVNCNRLSLVAPDAGTSGFYVDYSYDPAHVELVGPECTNVQQNGVREVDIIYGCGITQ